MSSSSRLGRARAVREPLLVRLPPSRAPQGARLVRLRLPDRPGSLAAIAAHLAGHGVNVLRLEVLGREGGWAVDDFLVSGAGLPAALAELESDVAVLADRPNVDLLDPGLAMADACATVTAAVSAREAYRQLVGAAIQLVFAEAGFVCIREGHGFLRPLASTAAGLPVLDDDATSLLRSAFFSGECLTADGRVPWAPPGFRELLPSGAVAAIPGGVPPFMVLALVRADDTPFVAAELERLAALVRVATGTLQLHRAGSPSAGKRASAGAA
jgi:ACT domain